MSDDQTRSILLVSWVNENGPVQEEYGLHADNHMDALAEIANFFSFPPFGRDMNVFSITWRRAPLGENTPHVPLGVPP